MKKYWFLTALCIFVLTRQICAQTQGCLLNGVLYNTSATVIPNTQCGWATPAAVASTWTTTQKNQCTSYGGVAGGYNQIPCPIDDYIPYFFIGIAGLGGIYIRNCRFGQNC